jgi:oxygen-independent coproporphyrinogen-3 oxidase
MSSTDLVTRYDIPIPRYTSYPTAPHFNPAVTADTYAGWLAALPEGGALSLYLHVPFCDRLCLYCGCNTAVVRQDPPRRAYAANLLRELRMVAACIGRRAAVGHVHWGGGTPTALPADCLDEVMALIRTLFVLSPQAEVAIEIDPTSLPADRLTALTTMGVNRVSFGVQDFDPAVQNAIGRMQSFEATRDCAQAIRGIGIASLNLDLMYGLPLQTEHGVSHTARQALRLAADRAAVFGYAHVPWMKRHQSLIPDDTLPDGPARFAQSRAIARVLEDEGGYRPVGLDHYAMPGDTMAEAAAARTLRRSFQGYTTDAAPVLIGIGASAIGCLPQGYVQNASTAAAYNAAIESGRLAAVRGIALTQDDRLRRDVIERIMCDLHVDLWAIAAAHATTPDGLLDADAELDRMAADGIVRWDGRVVEVTEAGRPFVRNVAAVFDAYLGQGAPVRRHARAV